MVETSRSSEPCLIDPRGSVRFYRLMARMSASHPDESKLMFLPLLHLDSVDLRGLPAIRA